MDSFREIHQCRGASRNEFLRYFVLSHVSRFFALNALIFLKPIEPFVITHSFIWPSRAWWIDSIDIEGAPHPGGAVGTGCDGAVGGAVAEVEVGERAWSRVCIILQLIVITRSMSS
jgi:hypothetical protein